ncbi:hypothetical protein N8T08_001261 [Aspergillus melleus]|uniref:Uncharacterized protein n=1 Tax=Aspergillus melleus TaxID=138277 RepID=A0ACC3ANL0_9EURO|nr:hypothetical protein N8T08_001261 [Aspergillus melleus]
MFGDGTFQYRHGIAVAQVVTFTISLAFSIWFSLRGRIGWFCIGMLSIIRLVGASCMLGTINKDADGLWAGVFVCESPGMILILFLLPEMLDRINKSNPTTPRLAFLIPQLLTYLDICISIAGFIAITKKEHALLPTSYSRAGTALIVAIYLWTVGVFLTFHLHRSRFPTTEKKHMSLRRDLRTNISCACDIFARLRHYGGYDVECGEGRSGEVFGDDDGSGTGDCGVVGW